MIYITKLNDKKIMINSDLIIAVESTPDTTISMTTGHKYIARESVDDILKSIIDYRRTINSGRINATGVKTDAGFNTGETDTDTDRG